MARCEDAPCCGCCSFAAMYAEPDPYDAIDRFYDDDPSPYDGTYSEE